MKSYKKEKKNRHTRKLVEGLWKFYPGEEKLTYLCKIKSFMSIRQLVFFFIDPEERNDKSVDLFP